MVQGHNLSIKIRKNFDIYHTAILKLALTRSLVPHPPRRVCDWKMDRKVSVTGSTATRNYRTTSPGYLTQGSQKP